MPAIVTAKDLLALRLGSNINDAIEKEDWCGVAEAVEAHHRDRGKPLTEEQMKQIAEGFQVAGETLPLASGTREKAPAAIDSDSYTR